MAHHKPWSVEDDELLSQLYCRHTDIADMAQALCRTVLATRQRIIILKLGPVAERYWRPEEIEQLQELWGTKTIPKIAKILGRSVHSIKVKSTRLHLGAFKHSSEYLTANQVAVLMGVDRHAVTDYWIARLNLPYKAIAPLGKQKFKYIKLLDLISWLQTHPTVWDSRRLEMFALGEEPDWLKEKRRLDSQAPAKRLQNWTPADDRQLISLFKLGGRTNQQMGEILGRSAAAIEHRLMRLDVWGTGRYIGNTHQQVKKDRREKLDRMMAIKRLHDALLYRRNQLAFDGYWQKEMCQHWDDMKGCTAHETDCDSCSSFQRLQPQYCRRCGSTVFSRTTLPDRLCQRCRRQRKSQYFKKMKALGKNSREDLPDG